MLKHEINQISFLILSLKAARCLYNERKQLWADSAQVFVLHGDFSVPGNWSVNYYQAEDYVIHENYNFMDSGNPYDIALVKLEDQVKKKIGGSGRRVLGPCHLRPRSFRYGTVIGLGLTNHERKFRSPQLVEISLKTDFSCGGLFLKGLATKQYQTCFYDHNAEKTTAADVKRSIEKTDAGAPLLYKLAAKTGFTCIIGISNFKVYSPKHNEFLSVFTHAPMFQEWISAQMEDLYAGRL